MPATMAASRGPTSRGRPLSLPLLGAMMTPLQRVIEGLLLATASSRAVLHVVRADGEFEIQAEAVQHGQRQIRHQPDLKALVAPSADLFKGDEDLIVENDVVQAPAFGPCLEA